MSLQRCYNTRVTRSKSESVYQDLCDENLGICGSNTCHRGAVKAGVFCDECRYWFHYPCAKTTKRIVDTQFKGREFHCPKCASAPHDSTQECTQMEECRDSTQEHTQTEERLSSEPCGISEVYIPQIDVEGTSQTVHSATMTKDVQAAYQEIVFFRKNLFNIPSGKAGKEFITELTSWMKHFNSENSPYQIIALKVFMILPALMLQKPFQKSKTKDHVVCLNKRLELWKTGKLDYIMKEAKLIQSKLKSSQSKKKEPADTARIFAKLIMEGKIKNALSLLEEQSQQGVLPLNDATLAALKEKHPTSEPALPNSLLFGPIDYVPESVFEEITEESVQRAANSMRGAAGPSGLDSEVFRRILCSKNFESEGKALRIEIATATRKLCTKHYSPDALEALAACRLLALDKNPGIRPIGIGEVLRRLMSKCVVQTFREEIKEAAGPLQTCAGFAAGCEAAIHAMKQMYDEEASEGVVLIDASNAFNKMNRGVALHNIQLLCPVISTFIINMYRKPSRLFIPGGGEISSEEGTTQGDPLAMPWFAINTRKLITRLLDIRDVKQAWLADDASACGKINDLFQWYKVIMNEGVKDGYVVNEKKCWLILKNPDLLAAARDIFGSTINYTIDGQRHLGAVIGSPSFKEEYCTDKVRDWTNQLSQLSKFATTQPHAAYIAYTKGFKSKLTYFLRTIPHMCNLVEPLQRAIDDCFIPALFGEETPFDNSLLQTLSLPVSSGGMGISRLYEEAISQSELSLIFSKPHVVAIKNQVNSGTVDVRESRRSMNERRKELDQLKINKAKELILDPRKQRNLRQLCDKGASSWMTALPVKEQDMYLNRSEFHDAVALRYGLPLKNLPRNCPCGSVFSVEHGLNCKKGGYVAARHDKVRNLLAGALQKVCKNVQVEPPLLRLEGEQLHRSANTSNEARLDIKGSDFWMTGQVAFFDVRVTHVNAATHADKESCDIFKLQEEEKKRAYLERVTEVENGSFTPLVFGTNGGMGSECSIFLSNLAAKLSRTDETQYAKHLNYLRTRLSFSILKSAITCVRGTRQLWTKVENTLLDDVNQDSIKANI